MIDNGYSESKSFIEGIKTVSAGHIFANKGRKIERPAGRQDYLLFYVASGSESFYINGEKNTAESGSFIIYKPGEPQVHICEQGASEFYYVHFEIDGINVASLIPFETSRVYITSAKGTLSTAFQQIIDELQFKRPYFEEIAVTKLKELFYILRRKSEEPVSSSELHQQKQIQKIIHEINITWNIPLTLEDYAARFGLSKYYFLRIFKESTGLSPIAYRNRIRMRHAEEMLCDSDSTILSISAECGFESPQYFCDAFKAVYGVSPSEYRRK